MKKIKFWVYNPFTKKFYNYHNIKEEYNEMITTTMCVKLYEIYFDHYIKIYMQPIFDNYNKEGLNIFNKESKYQFYYLDFDDI